MFTRACADESRQALASNSKNNIQFLAPISIGVFTLQSRGFFVLSVKCLNLPALNRLVTLVAESSSCSAGNKTFAARRLIFHKPHFVIVSANRPHEQKRRHAKYNVEQQRLFHRRFNRRPPNRRFARYTSRPSAKRIWRRSSRRRLRGGTNARTVSAMPARGTTSVSPCG